jgi:hypothetical protein
MTDRVFSLSYGIPDECIVSEVPFKKQYLAPYLPGTQYTFNHTQEADYYQMYRDSMFAITQRKGGWDCLRHYEIMANGCIPIFLGLDKCPYETLKSFPKELVKGAMENIRPWDEKGYQEYVGKILAHVREHLSCSSLARRFLRIMENKSGKPIQKILMLCGHPGVNYSRELLWIGLKRLLEERERQENGERYEECAVEYPRMKYLYRDYPLDKSDTLYGKGFTYSRRIDAHTKRGSWGNGENIWIEDRIRRSILDKEWDIVFYGKVGPDELEGGTIESMPFWEEVSSCYGVNEIAFLYGGDECQDMTSMNRYSAHLLRHMEKGICFVREINTETH